jgi:HlyD family secretion protein
LENYKNLKMNKINKLSLLLSGLILMVFSACQQQETLSDAYGNFDAHAEAIVSAQSMGQLLWFNIEQGDHLKVGKVVGQIDTTDLHLKKQVLSKQKEAIAAQLISLNANVKVQQEQLDISLKNQKRIQNLFSHQAATQKQLDDVNGMVSLNRMQIQATQSRKKSIKAQMKSVDAQIAAVNESIHKCSIKNIVQGTVLVKYAEKGELMTPGKPLYKIAGLETLELNAYVSGSDLNRIKTGQQVEVYYDRSKEENYKTKGTIIWISPQAEFTPKTIQTKEERVNLVYAVKVKVDNPSGTIKIGMPGEFRIKK